jgi:hypothetical protein
MNWLKTTAGKATIGVVILALAVGLTWSNWPRESALPNRIRCVCVATGKVFSMDRQSLSFMPAKNPDTGEQTLLPVTERDGELFVVDRARPVIDQLGEVNKVVDPKTLRVNKGS